MKTLPTLSELPSYTTTGDLIERVNLQVTFDYALPQQWVNDCMAHNFDPRGQVVWAYPKGSFGCPAPLTQEAWTSLRDLGVYCYTEC